MQKVASVAVLAISLL